MGVSKDERGDLFLSDLRLAISKQPCLRGKPFSCPRSSPCFIFSRVGRRRSPFNAAFVSGVSGRVCILSGSRKGGAMKGSQGHSGLDRQTSGLEARAQVHHCRQWKALQKAIGLSVILASVVWAVL